MLHNRQAPGRDFHEHFSLAPARSDTNLPSNPQSAPAPSPLQDRAQARDATSRAPHLPLIPLAPPAPPRLRPPAPVPLPPPCPPPSTSIRRPDAGVRQNARSDRQTPLAVGSHRACEADARIRYVVNAFKKKVTCIPKKKIGDVGCPPTPCLWQAPASTQKPKGKPGRPFAGARSGGTVEGHVNFEEQETPRRRVGSWQHMAHDGNGLLFHKPRLEPRSPPLASLI